VSVITDGISIFITQLLGVWMYFWDKDYYYAWMAMCKQYFAITTTTMTYWWAPTVVRISWDKSCSGQFQKAADGRLVTNFPERLILIANHQVRRPHTNLDTEPLLTAM
jgi:lysocardiolipin and lysophospholipid acyltransferase